MAFLVNKSTIAKLNYYNADIGIWSIRLFVIAALPNPGIVGWSGIVARKWSRHVLKQSTLCELMSRISRGNKLKILAAFTDMEASFAFLLGHSC